MPVHGLEHLDAARAGERGTILAALHAGPMLNLVYALAARGHTVHVAGGHRLTEPPLRGHHGRWIKTQNVWVEEAGCRWVRRPGAFGVLRVVLERGGIAWVNVDAGGGTPGRLLGRTLRTRGGAAALARATNALVIPAGVLRERFGQAAFLLPAIDPGDVASEDELTRRIWEALDPVMRPRRAQAHADLARHLAAGGGAA
jgi:lauroyl/myristoyl acyltransferase